MLALRDIPLGRQPVNHDFPAGAISVVLGRNRSGKTRLCRLIAGLEDATPGMLSVDGEDVTRLSPGRRSVALVYQAFVNYPNLTVFDNIASPLRARRVAADTIRERVREIAAKLRLDGLLERLPAQLSGGQQQRLAIGRALAKSARVLVLDEPLVNLDYKLREALEFELRDMLGRDDLTVIYTTSDPKDAFNLGDHLVLLDDHRIVQAGVPLDVYERPTSVTAADLMSDPGVNRWREGHRDCAVRPEQLTLEAPAGTGRAFDFSVVTVETNGAETFLHGRVHDDHWVVRLRGLHRVAAGERLSVHAPAEAILSFENTSRG